MLGAECQWGLLFSQDCQQLHCGGFYSRRLGSDSSVGYQVAFPNISGPVPIDVAEGFETHPQLVLKLILVYIFTRNFRARNFRASGVLEHVVGDHTQRVQNVAVIEILFFSRISLVRASASVAEKLPGEKPPGEKPPGE